MRTTRTLSVILAAIAVLALCGCNGKVQPKPFVEFHAAMSEASQSVEETSLGAVTEERARLVAELAAGREPDDLILKPVADQPYTWDMNKPTLYFSLKNAHAGLVRLNNSFVRYAARLESFASKTHMTDEDVTALAGDLNDNAKAALSALRSAAGEKGGDGTEIISVAAANAMQRYVDSRKHGVMSEIIKAAQSNIQKLCDKVRYYLVLLNSRAQETYSVWAENELPLTLKGKPKEAEAVIAKTEQAFELTALMESIDQIYMTIPDAHRDLLKTEKESVLTSINNLAVYALKLRTQYEDLKSGDDAGE